MQNKLQELTDKLYNEGLSKGKSEAEQMKANAQKEAAQIIAQAKDEAKKILESAQNDAAELKSKTESDIKMAASQTFSTIKQQIEKIILTKSLTSPVKEAVSNTEFLKSIITQIVSAFNPNSSDSMELNLILPTNKKEELDNFIKNNISKICTEGVNVEYSKNIGSGFKIGPKDQGYMVSFTDSDFENLIAEYLRPKTKALLFEK